jgi:hypothetical protein
MIGIGQEGKRGIKGVNLKSMVCSQVKYLCKAPLNNEYEHKNEGQTGKTGPIRGWY